MSIDMLITDFIKERAKLPEPYFEIRTLIAYVQNWKKNHDQLVTDGSVRRVLRRLRAQGEVQYQVVNKKTGQYRALGAADRSFMPDYSIETQQ